MKGLQNRTGTTASRSHVINQQNLEGFSGSPAVKTPCFHRMGHEELRSHVLSAMAGGEKKGRIFEKAEKRLWWIKEFAAYRERVW